MGLFVPRLFPEIMQDMLAELIDSTPLNDVNFGSVFVSMLEAAAQEDDEQYFQMLEIIRGYSLDSVFGSDLDDRASEYSIERRGAGKASTPVTISDPAITKIETGVYSGSPGSPAGSTSIRGDDATGFPVSGSIVIGRGTVNVETRPYGSITQSPNFVTFNLTAALAFDHGTDESIILAQGGNRFIGAGTVVKVPASDTLKEVVFTTDDSATLLDGESSISGIIVTATTSGTSANVPIGAIQQFDSQPFSGAVVTNPQRVTNGIDVESDQELRDRIKDTIQSLSKGTPRAIITGVNGLVSSSDNKRVVSVSLRDTTVPAEVVKLFIDDGTGFIPDFASIGFETVVAQATGGEQFLFSSNVPLVKAFVQTQNAEPYNIPDGATLFIDINGLSEVVTFTSSDFAAPGAATAQEVLKKINSSATSYESRVTTNGTKVKVFSRSSIGEEIRVTGGTANVALNFPTTTEYTANLYRTRNFQIKRLSKDGRTAAIESGATATYDFSVDAKRHLSIIVDGKVNNILKAWFQQSDFVAPGSLNVLDVCTTIENQVPGLVCDDSSQITRFTLSSRFNRNELSKIRIVENFTSCFNEEAGLDVDRTTEFATSGSNVTMFAADNDYVHLGHSDIPFDSVFVKLATPASVSIAPTFEYYKGGVVNSFTEFGVNDETDGFQQDGHILFQPPFDWVKTTVNSVSAYWIRIRRNQPVVAVPPVESRLRVCGANEEFQFSETEVAGVNQDYRLNRFIGQFELVEPLLPNDNLTLGSDNTRASATTVSQGNYNGLVGTALDLTVDSVLQSYTFLLADVGDPLSISATEVATVINREYLGVTATVVDAGTRVKIVCNRMVGGTLLVGGAANSILDFTDELQTALVTHQPAIESLAGPFAFSVNDNFLVVIDGNTADNQTIPMYSESVTTTVTSDTIFEDLLLITKFPNTDQIAGFDVEFIDGPAAGDRREISTYNPFTGQVVLTSSLSATPDPGDKYQVIPKTTAQVVQFINNSAISLLSNKAEIKAVDAGTRVQIASLTFGNNASVSVVGGAANDELGFPLFKSAPDAYKHYTGLAQLVQKTVDGVADDPDNFEGIRAAGVQVEVIEPVGLPISVQLDITTNEGVSLTGVQGNVKSAVTNYINNLHVSDDVIASDLIVAVKGVDGVFDAQIISLPGSDSSGNIPVADNELARIAESDILVG